MFGIVGAVILLLGGCAVLLAGISSESSDDVVAVQGVADLDSDGVPSGAVEDPLSFGMSHTRSPGFRGVGWTVSIDEVREVAADPLFGDLPDGQVCMAVIGTASVDELPEGELTSNPFSFPSIVLVDNGVRIDSEVLECDEQALRDLGLVWYLDMALVEGGTARWFKTFVTDGDYDLVAVEETVYAPE